MALIDYPFIKLCLLFTACNNKSSALPGTAYLSGEGDEEQEQGDELNLLLAEPAPVGVTTVPAASEIIERVLEAVHGDLAKLLNEDNLQLGFLDVARQFLAGKDESAELQARACLCTCARSVISCPGSALAKLIRICQTILHLSGHQCQDPLALSMSVVARQHSLHCFAGCGGVFLPCS